MREATGDIWDYPVVVITTNGDVNKAGECVMGRGIALQAKQRYPKLASTLASWIKKYGNTLMVYPNTKVIITLPVKHHWNEKADITLIKDSVKELVRLTDLWQFSEVALVRPGCGNGQLRWNNVKPQIEPFLDDRFVVVENGCS